MDSRPPALWLWVVLRVRSKDVLVVDKAYADLFFIALFDRGKRRCLDSISHLLLDEYVGAFAGSQSTQMP